MGEKLKKIWLLAKLFFICLVAAWIVLFFYLNAGTHVDVWVFFGAKPVASLSIVVLVTAIVTLFVYFVARKVSGVLRQLKEVRSAEQTRQRDKKLEDLARQIEQKQTPIESKEKKAES